MPKLLLLILLSFILLPASHAQLINESFENETFPPIGWTTINQLGSNQWQRSILRAKDGFASAFIDYQLTGGDDWLITPPMILKNKYTLSFWLLRQFPTPYPPDNLEVRISTTTNNAASFITTIASINTAIISHLNWSYYEIPLHQFQGEEIYIAFRHTNIDGNGIWLDDVKVNLTPPVDVGISSSNIFNGIQINKSGKDLIAYVKNYGTVPVSNVEVFYNLGNQKEVGPVIMNSNILPGDSSPVVFSGANAISSAVDTSMQIKIYTSFNSDVNFTNDTLKATIYFQTPESEFPYIQTFGSVKGFVNSGANLWSLTTGVNPNGISNDTMLRANFYNVSSGNIGIIRSRIFDFSNIQNPVLSFYVSYRSYLTTENDRLQIAVSTDGGKTFNLGMPDLYNKSYLTSPSLATLPLFSFPWTPNGTQFEWRHETIDLSEFSGEDEIIIAFVATSDFGNNCFIDNMIVFDAGEIETFSVTGTGVYGSFENNKLVVNFIELDNSASTLTETRSEEITLSGFDVIDLKFSDTFTNEKVAFDDLKIPVEKLNPNLTSRLSSGILYLVTNDTFLSNDSINENLSATTQNGSVFTPEDISEVYWHITYSGDDYNSVATYDVYINLNTLTTMFNPDEVYILKRTDQTQNWTAINTTRSGDTLKATGLQGFSEFAIGYTKLSLIGLNVTVIPEGLFNIQTGELNLRDTIKAYLRNSIAPYEVIDSSVAVLDSLTFVANFIFENAPSGSYYLVIDHRNSLETWSRVGGEILTVGDMTLYNFTTESSRAFGNNMKIVNGRWCLISGDVNKDGVINAEDRAILWNFRNQVGYRVEDLNGDGIVNATDRGIVWNNTNKAVQRP